jgi:hypothetical protein
MHSRYRCTVNSCNQLTGQCQFEPISECCEYDSECVDEQDTCNQGKCLNGKCTFNQLECDDGDKCTEGSCENGACLFVPKECDDGNE